MSKTLRYCCSMANWSRSQINEVRQWLAINGKDIRYLADHISENYNTLKDYISPNTRRKEIPDTRLRNLYHLTKLECLKLTILHLTNQLNPHQFSYQLKIFNLIQSKN